MNMPAHNKRERRGRVITRGSIKRTQNRRRQPARRRR